MSHTELTFSRYKHAGAPAEDECNGNITAFSATKQSLLPLRIHALQQLGVFPVMTVRMLVRIGLYVADISL